MDRKPAYEDLEERVRTLEAKAIRREEVERALQESHERYRAVVEDQTELVCRFRAGGVLTFVNGAYCRYFGMRREDLLGRSFMSLIPEEDREAVQQMFDSLTIDNPASIYEHRVIGPGGEIHWQQWTDRALFDAQGRATEFQSVGRDITERKRMEEKLCGDRDELEGLVRERAAELVTANERLTEEVAQREAVLEALQEGEAQYRLLVENMTDLVVKVDLDGRFLFASPSYCDLFGITEDELLGNIFLPLVHEEDRDNSLTAMPDLYREPYRCYVEQRAKTEGGWRWLAWADKSVLNEQGQVVAIVGVGRDVTDVKRMEEKLRESETRYRSVVQDQEEFIVRWTPGGVRTFVNDAYCRCFGKTWEEMVGTSFFPLVPEEDLPRIVARIRALSPDMPAASDEHRAMLPDGTVAWLHWTDRGLFDESGRLVAIQSVGRDITERKQMEEALRHSEARFRSAFENAPIGMALVGIDQRFLQVNQRLCDILGYSEEELLATTVPGISDPEDQAWKSQQKEVAAVEESSGFETEQRYSHADGHVVWGRFSASLVRDAQGDPLYFIGQLEDITERKRAEEERDRLVTAVEQAADAIIVTDTEGLVQFVNPAFEAITGYGRAEAVGRCIRDLVESGEHAEAFHRNLYRTLERGDAWRGRFTNRKKDGSRYRTDATIFPVRDATGNVTSYVSVQYDLTEKLALEAKVRQAQKLESLGVLAGGIAHDFNNLLMGVLGNADLALLELSAESPGQKYVKKIETAALRAAELTNQMLAYSGKGQFLVEAIDLNRVVEEMVHLLHTAISKKARLQFRLEEGISAIEADPSQIRQVVMNLITNASDALGNRSGAIVLSTGEVGVDRAYLSGGYFDDDLSEGVYVYLEISDTGVGMDEETRQKIFDPFFSTKFTGRGLGLAAVSGIVRGHKGAIRVCSEAGRGTTFKVLFPRSEAVVRKEDQPAPVEWTETGTRVLVIDDDAGVRDVTKTMLEAAGFEVLTAADGVAGVETYRQCDADIALVILDMTMPRMSGDEAFREMRRIRPDVQVILSSGYSEQEATSRFAGEGLAGFIQKPFRRAKILRTIREVLRHS